MLNVYKAIDKVKKVVITIEDYWGNDVQSFKLHKTRGHYKTVDEKNQMTKRYGLVFSGSIKEIIDNLIDRHDLTIADIEEDYIFDTDLILIRLQENQKGMEDKMIYRLIHIGLDALLNHIYSNGDTSPHQLFYNDGFVIDDLPIDVSLIDDNTINIDFLSGRKQLVLENLE